MSERIHVQNYYTETAGRKPNVDDIKKGELAINTADEILFMKNKNNEIVEFIDKNAIQALIDENKIYVFNPEGNPAEEYEGLQDAVNNGKQVVMWAENGGISPVVCTVIYGWDTENAYYVMFSYTFAGNNEGTIFYNSVNVSETSIDVVGSITSPVITGVDDAMNINSTNPVQNKVIYEALGVVSEQANSKQEQLVSGTNIKTINGESILGSGDITIEGGETLTEADITAMGFTKNTGTITGVSANGTLVASSGMANIPAASTSKYGVTKLNSATNSTSTTEAATPSAVKAAYDLAKGKVGESDIFENKTDGIIKAEALYNDKSQGGLIYALPTSRLALEDNCDDVLVVRSEIFEGSPEQSMLQADAFYETTTGTIYGLPTSSIVTNGGEDEIIATESYVDRAVANAGGAYNLTSLTKAQLDSFTSGSTITINAADVSAIRANNIITITSNSGRCLMTAWSAQSSSVVQLTFLCDNVVYIAKASLQSNGTAKINEVAKHLVGGGDASASPFYITEFTLDNLRSSSFEQEYYPCDAAAVCTALDEGKIILVPVWDGATGYVVAKVYYEDLLYWTIYDESLLQVFTFEMGTTDTDIVSTNVSTSVLATQSYVDDAVANSDYTITSFTKATLDNVITGGSAITISTADYNAITANTKTIYINNGGSGGRCILSGWNVISSTSASFEFLCDGLIYICGVTIRNNIAKITSVKNIGNMCNVTHSSLTIYANETYYWNDSSYANATFSLKTPTNTNITNVFTIIIKNTTYAETVISFYTPNNTIVWANDNPPVLGGSDGGDTYGNYTEISIRYVDGKYLGTWTKFSAS